MFRQTFAIASLFLLIACGVQAQEPARYSARDVHLRIETDKSNYHLGEIVKVRLTLNNTAANVLKFMNDVPRGAVHLDVMDSSSHPLKVDPQIVNQWVVGNMEEVQLKPGEKWTLQWRGSEWMNLQDWGYRIQTAGRYVIVGAPYLFGGNVSPDKTIRSNQAAFNVRP